MKIYAEYFEENGLYFRKNTILQFGKNWNLIGNIVLANPGSANPLHKASEESTFELQLFYKQYKDNKVFKANNWFEFKSDATMKFVEKIFNGSYVDENIELNGVIQLFNTFNIKNKILKEAIIQAQDNSNDFSYGIEKYFHEKPTYFGFSQAVLKDKNLCRVAKEIFDNSSETIRSIYNNNFLKNSFYHPMYINRAYNQEHFQKYKKNVLLLLFKNIENNMKSKL